MQFDRRKLLVWCTFAFVLGLGGGYAFFHGKLDGQAIARFDAQGR